MNDASARKALLDEPERHKLVRLDDGRSFRVRGVEHWALGYNSLLLLDEQFGQITFPVRKIASIRDARPRRRRQKK